MYLLVCCLFTLYRAYMSVTISSDSLCRVLEVKLIKEEEKNMVGKQKHKIMLVCM